MAVDAGKNAYLTAVDHGSPMGALLRSYWIPLLYSHELAEPDGPPRRIRLLGESLVAFRDTDGGVGLFDQHCPHRRASLFFGRNEEGGLRCAYHGWKFGIDGRCLDIPSEPANCPLLGKVRAKAYPCREANGIIWTYMGDARREEELPPLPIGRLGGGAPGAANHPQIYPQLQLGPGDGRGPRQRTSGVPAQQARAGIGARGR